MSVRRMFTTDVTDNDNFLLLSSSAQALYLHLTMAADDEGFCNQVSLSMFKAHASVQDLEALVEKKYVIQFESGVVVLKHWKMANKIRSERVKQTAFQKERSLLELKSNGSYRLLEDVRQMSDKCLTNVCQMSDSCLPNDGQMSAQDSIGEDSIGEYKRIKDKVVQKRPAFEVNYQPIADLYNETCVSFPRLTTLSEARKRAIKARLKVYTLDDFKRLFEKAEASSFLKGRNDRNWSANFDWLIKDGNMAKVLDGNYDDRGQSSGGRQTTNKVAQQLDEFYGMVQDWVAEGGSDG